MKQNNWRRKINGNNDQPTNQLIDRANTEQCAYSNEKDEIIWRRKSNGDAAQPIDQKTGQIKRKRLYHRLHSGQD